MTLKMEEGKEVEDLKNSSLYEFTTWFHVYSFFVLCNFHIRLSGILFVWSF